MNDIFTAHKILWLFLFRIWETVKILIIDFGNFSHSIFDQNLEEMDIKKAVIIFLPSLCFLTIIIFFRIGILQRRKLLKNSLNYVFNLSHFFVHNIFLRLCFMRCFQGYLWYDKPHLLIIISLISVDFSLKKPDFRKYNRLWM